MGENTICKSKGLNYKALRCVLWGTGKIFFENINLIKYYEQKDIIQIVGVTSNELPLLTPLFGWCWKEKKEIAELEPELIIVMTGRKFYKEICLEAYEIGIKEDNVISYEVLKMPNFELDSYLSLKRNPPTIFTNFCWGGLHIINYFFLFVRHLLIFLFQKRIILNS